MVSIDHVIVLVLENRSFDHVLGYLDHPNPDFDGLLDGGPHTNPGWDSGPAVAASPDAKPVLPLDPDHSHDAVLEQLAVQGSGAHRQATNQGFVSSYERKCRGLAPASFGGLLGPLLNWWTRRGAATSTPSSTPSSSTPSAGRGPLAMLCQPPQQVPVLATLAREFAVCTRWFSSVPGETWPNRNFLHAATSDGDTDIEPRFYTDRTIFELLEEHGRDWHVYHDDTPQLWAFPKLWDTPERHAKWFEFTAFAQHAADGTLPAYSFIEPNHRPPLHTLDHAPLVGAPDVSDSQHPGNNLVTDDAYDAYDAFTADSGTDFARGEALIASVYESLRANPALFERSLLLITYDEHGGLYDHVPPPTGVPAPGDGRGLGARLGEAILHRTAKSFDFTMLGVRVPAVVVSPYVAAGTVCTDVHDHASVPATLRAIFAPDAEPLTRRDAWATPFHGVLGLAGPRSGQELPDLSVHAPAVHASVTRTHAGQPARALAQLAGLSATAPPGSGSAPASVSDAVPVPPHAKDFADQADRVWARLNKVGEPEMKLPIAPDGTAQRALQISEAFAVAAQRHRSAEAEG
jgi:phospholipase C